MRGYFPESVSDFTKEQCEEYLSAHPNGLRADSVRARLRVIAPENKPSEKKVKEEKSKERKIEQTKSESANRQVKTDNPEKPTEPKLYRETKNKSAPNDVGGVILKLLCCAGAIALVAFAAYKWQWIGAGAAGPMAYIACRNIWNEW